MDLKSKLPTIAMVMFVLAAIDGLLDHNWMKAGVLLAVGICFAVAALAIKGGK